MIKKKKENQGDFNNDEDFFLNGCHAYISQEDLQVQEIMLTLSVYYSR